MKCLALVPNITLTFYTAPQQRWNSQCGRFLYIVSVLVILLWLLSAFRVLNKCTYAAKKEQLSEMEINIGKLLFSSLTRCGDAPEHVSCKSRSLWRECRAVLPDKRDTACHEFFLCQNAWAWQRVVSWRNKWNTVHTSDWIRRVNTYSMKSDTDCPRNFINIPHSDNRKTFEVHSLVAFSSLSTLFDCRRKRTGRRFYGPHK